jgi:hypothetical protein
MLTPVHQLYSYWRIRDQSVPVRRLISDLDDLGAIVRGTLADSGMPAKDTWYRAGTDGWAAVFPAGADVVSVLAEVPRRALSRLAGYNERRLPDARLRLAVAFAIGPIVSGPSGTSGPLGQGPREAARLARLGGHEAETPFATVLSHALHEQYVAPGFRFDLGPGDFRPVELDGTRAWLA